MYVGTFQGCGKNWHHTYIIRTIRIYIQRNDEMRVDGKIG